jgi:thiol:disulfide interchange protein DsbD
MTALAVPPDYLKAFFGGILLSITPCLYPLIPVSAGYISAKSGGRKLKAFALSLIYVTGIAVTYSALGIAASLSGKIFGSLLPDSVSNILAGSLIILFGIGMLDIFHLPLPKSVKFPAPEKSGYFAAFILGLGSGLVISPCTTPVLGAILAYLAARQNIVYGATLLFVFAYGMGIILILTGTFSALLVWLPKSGRWMQYVKKICAILLLIMGAYFLFSGIGMVRSVNAAEVTENARFPAPDFSLPDLKGNAVALSSYRGKQPVLLFFWTTRCHLCLKALRVLKEKHPDLSASGLEVLCLDIGESQDRVSRFMQRNAFACRVLLDTDADVAYRYEVIGVPTYILVDKQGNIVFADFFFPFDNYKRLLSESRLSR